MSRIDVDSNCNDDSGISNEQLAMVDFLISPLQRRCSLAIIIVLNFLICSAFSNETLDYEFQQKFDDCFIIWLECYCHRQMWVTFHGMPSIPNELSLVEWKARGDNAPSPDQTRNVQWALRITVQKPLKSSKSDCISEEKTKYNPLIDKILTRWRHRMTWLSVEFWQENQIKFKKCRKTVSKLK